MKIKKEKLRNFARFTNFEVEFDKQITHLVGLNGAGKSTVGLTAVWAGLKGIAEKNATGQLIGERFRFIGRSGASSDIEITLVDEEKGAEITVKNHITASTNQITFQAPDGYVTDPLWLNNLLNVSFLSAKNFSMLSPKEQALTLGIDVSDYDNKIKAKKELKKIENGKLQMYKDLAEVEKVEKVSMQALVTKREALEERQKGDKMILNTREYYMKLHKKLSDELKRACNGNGGPMPIKLGDEDEAVKIIPEFHQGIIDLIEELAPKLPTMDPALQKDIEAYAQEVKNIDETNRKADLYAQYLVKKEVKVKIEAEIKKLDKEIDKLTEDRLSHIKKTNMGFQGLAIDDEGGLLFDEGNGPRPIKEPYYSKGQLEIIVAKLYAATNPTLKVRFIDDFDSLDEANQEKIVKFLLDQGFQVITSSVGTAAKHENTIILRECTINEYKVQEEILI